MEGLSLNNLMNILRAICGFSVLLEYTWIQERCWGETPNCCIGRQMPHLGHGLMYTLDMVLLHILHTAFLMKVGYHAESFGRQIALLVHVLTFPSIEVHHKYVVITQ